MQSFFDSKLPLTPSNLISLTFLVSLRSFTLFRPKIKAFKWQKKLCLKCKKYALLGNCFSELFTEVEIWY